MRRYWSSSGEYGALSLRGREAGEVDAEEQAAIASKTKALPPEGANKPTV